MAAETKLQLALMKIGPMTVNNQKWAIQNVTSESTFIKATITDFTLVKLYKYICFMCTALAVSKKDT